MWSSLGYTLENLFVLVKHRRYVKYLRAYKNLSYREIIQESVNDAELSCIMKLVV